MTASDAQDAERHAASPRLAAFEVAWIFLIFFLFAGSPAPDVGESHYLVKAKHYWQPEWCAGDLFLESRDAHAAFYWTFGWVTKFCSLTATAWIGRVITWLLLAWSWRRLSWAVVPQPLVSLLSAGLLLLLLRHFHLAGEWIVGGVEAKGFAYALVFLALESLVTNRWRAAIILAGAAGAFHVLVGGWTVVAIGLAWLFPSPRRPALTKLIPAAVLGFLMALPGLVTALALNSGVPAEIQREAARIYVFERLSHHLVFHAFSETQVARFQMSLVAWAALAWLLRSETPLSRLQRAVAGSIVIAFLGVVIDQVYVWQSDRVPTEVWQTSAAQLLRYYWYRLADALVPIGVALGIVAGVARLRPSAPSVAAWLQAIAILLAAANIADVYYWRSHQRVPPAILQPRPTADSIQRSWFWPAEVPPENELPAKQWYGDWRAACDWVRQNTPADAVYLTPREQQTFKWYAGRAEVVNWKDVPQDARGLVEWNRRMSEVYPRDKEHHRRDLAAFTDKQLVELAQRFEAAFVIVDLTRTGRPIGLPRVYPIAHESNSSFAVYRVPEPRSP